MRLNKFLAQAGVASRRAVDRLISEGKVSVDGKVATLGQQVKGQEKMIVEEKEIKSIEEKEYFMLHKEVGVVSTASDEMGRKKVTDVVKSNKRLYPVGRLDQDSEGLILLTNDGDLALRLTHPKFHLEKEYEVTLDRKIGNKKIDTGINKITKINKNMMTIVMYEGKKRQIRLMCWEAGLRVKKLKRVRIGNLRLGDLGPGEYRSLTPREVESLKRL